MYETIKKLRPYFFSLRETPKDLVILDLKIPLSWKYDFLNDENIGFLEQDKNTTTLLLSIITQNTEDGYTTLIDYGVQIIKKNKEFEDKETLLKEKIQELKQLFNEESLDKLKEIDFLKHGHENSTGSYVVE